MNIVNNNNNNNNNTNGNGNNSNQKSFQAQDGDRDRAALDEAEEYADNLARELMRFEEDSLDASLDTREPEGKLICRTFCHTITNTV